MEAGAAKSIASGSSEGGPRALADRYFATWRESIMAADTRDLKALHIRIFCALLLVSRTNPLPACESNLWWIALRAGC